LQTLNVFPADPNTHDRPGSLSARVFGHNLFHDHMRPSSFPEILSGICPTLPRPNASIPQAKRQSQPACWDLARRPTTSDSFLANFPTENAGTQVDLLENSHEVPPALPAPVAKLCP